MKAVTLVSRDKYLTTCYRPDREWVDGELLKRHLGEYSHSRAVGATLVHLNRSDWGLKALISQRIQVKPTLYRVPDVCAIFNSAPFEQILTHPPFVIAEILARQDRFAATMGRLEEFRSMGVPNIWLVEPLSRTAFQYSSRGLEKVTDGIMRTTNPEIFVTLSEIFED